MPAALDTRYLERRPRGTGRWYVVQDVPLRLQPVLGKRLVKATGTADLREARTRRHAVLADFERQMADARRGGPTDELTREAMAYGESYRRLRHGDGSKFQLRGPGKSEDHDLRHKKWELQNQIEERALEIASLPDWDVMPDGQPVDPRKRALADQFTGIAYGTATPLLLHVETWLAQGNRRKPPSPATVQSYRASVKMLAEMLKAHGVTSIEGVTRALAGRVVNEMAARRDDPGTIHKRVAAMSSYWKWLQRRGIARDDIRNVWHEQGVAGTAKQDKRPFTDSEMLALFNGPADTEQSDAMRILALSGMRVHELYNLHVRDCAGGWFDIRASKTQAGVRRVPIHSALAEIIARRSTGKKPDAFLMHEAGGPSVRRSGAFVKDFGRYRQACGVDAPTGGRQSAVTLHTFRAWFASAIRASHDESVTATILGHAKRGITDRAYTKFSDERLKVAVEAVSLPATVRT